MPPTTPGPDWPQHFSALLEAAPDAMLVVDGAGVIVLLNAQAERVFGYPRGELTGARVEALMPESFRGRHAHHRRGYLEAPRSRPMGTAEMELVAQRKDGSTFPAEISLSPLRTEAGTLVIAAVRDLTGRRKVEERFRALLEAAPDAMLVTDREDRIVLLNARAQAVFGYGRDELLLQPVELLLPAHLRLGRQRGTPPDAEHPLKGVGAELSLQRRDGTRFLAEVSSSPFETEQGTFTIAAVRDVSDRKRAEEERARYHEAREAVRLRDEFLSIASHELKTPLTPLLIEAESLLRLAAPRAALVPTELVARKAQKIQRMVQRLHGLVGDLLDVSRIVAGRLQLERSEVDLRALALEVAGRFEEQARRAGSAVTVEGDAVVGRFDPTRMDQVISNLLVNAIKYGSGEPVRIELSAAEGRVDLAVKDRGIGISEEHQARIFGRFERAVSRRNYGGFGLGLWIVRQIVEAHGGSVSVSSRPGEGSEFRVALPLERPAP